MVAKDPLILFPDLSHLTPGQNLEILRKIRFPQVNGSSEEKSPETILEHEFQETSFVFLEKENQVSKIGFH
ncbi:hypothetical protein ACS0TY_013376 [Phlomoides rotata]